MGGLLSGEQTESLLEYAWVVCSAESGQEKSKSKLPVCTPIDLQFAQQRGQAESKSKLQVYWSMYYGRFVQQRAVRRKARANCKSEYIQAVCSCYSPDYSLKNTQSDIWWGFRRRSTAVGNDGLILGETILQETLAQLMSLVVQLMHVVAAPLGGNVSITEEGPCGPGHDAMKLVTITGD